MNGLFKDISRLRPQKGDLIILRISDDFAVHDIYEHWMAAAQDLSKNFPDQIFVVATKSQGVEVIIRDALIRVLEPVLKKMSENSVWGCDGALPSDCYEKATIEAIADEFGIEL